MSFRTKLLAFFLLTVVASVVPLAWLFSTHTQRAFENLDRQRTQAVVAQFQREYAQRGDEIAHRVQGIADAEATLRMAMDLSRPQADASQYYNDARGLAKMQQLDFVDIVGNDGALISSAEWPDRSGYKNDWVGNEPDWNSQAAFLSRVDTPDTVELALLAVRAVRVGDKRLYIVGGQRIDQDILSTLVLPEGASTLLYRNLEPGFAAPALVDLHGPAAQPDRFARLILDVQHTPQAMDETINLPSDDSATSSDVFHAVPLTGRDGGLLAILLVGTSRQDLDATLNFVRTRAALVGAGVLPLGLLFSWWISAPVTRSIEELTLASRAVATGHSETRVVVRSADEVGKLGAAFNNMVAQVADRQDRLVQTERVAAWRELARRFAHELKESLFPLQLTAEELQRTHDKLAGKVQKVFVEISGESIAALHADVDRLKATVGRFSDFAKMPAPEFSSTDLNELTRTVVKSFEPQFSAMGRPPILLEIYLDENLAHPQVDSVALRRVFENITLHALGAMPSGGTLTVRTSQQDGRVTVEFADTGTTLKPEELTRWFTSYYADGEHGSGLELATVLAIVSDHGGKIVIEPAGGPGSTLRIELPVEHLSGHLSGHSPGGHLSGHSVGSSVEHADTPARSEIDSSKPA